MSNFRTYKFLIIPVIQEVDDEGNVIQEMSSEQPTPVYGIKGLHTYADSFELDLAARVPEIRERQQQ